MFVLTIYDKKSDFIRLENVKRFELIEGSEIIKIITVFMWKCCWI